MSARTLVPALLLAAASLIRAQTPPAFDVASVKPANPDEHVVSYSRSGEFMGSLQALIRTAYGVEDYRISGGPKWLDSDKFSVLYKPVGPQASLMLRTLLAERFKLALHTETKQLPVYTLVIAKNGSKMEKTDGSSSNTSSGPALIRGTMDMPALVSFLSSILGRRVNDATGLEGYYKFSLKWTPDDQPATASVGGGPSLSTAIQEQLGLKLESSKGPVDILVIDHAEKPTEN